MQSSSLGICACPIDDLSKVIGFNTCNYNWGRVYVCHGIKPPFFSPSSFASLPRVNVRGYTVSAFVAA